MNIWDKTSLFRLSYAVQRRFAIINVGLPSDAVYAEIIDSANGLLMPWVRAKVTVAGTTPPAVDATIDVVSTGPFQLSNS